MCSEQFGPRYQDSLAKKKVSDHVVKEDAKHNDKYIKIHRFIYYDIIILNNSKLRIKFAHNCKIKTRK
jgi:hypothetical protein